MRIRDTPNTIKSRWNCNRIASKAILVLYVHYRKPEFYSAKGGVGPRVLVMSGQQYSDAHTSQPRDDHQCGCKEQINSHLWLRTVRHTMHLYIDVGPGRHYSHRLQVHFV